MAQKKHVEEDKGESAPLWIISFADLVTLMLSFFVILAAGNPKEASYDPEFAAIGKALAVALLGTLYGCLICNVICGPIADKLALRSSEEQFVKEMILVGVLSIQAGDNPRVVQLKLNAFVSEKDRTAIQTEGG